MNDNGSYEGSKKVDQKITISVKAGESPWVVTEEVARLLSEGYTSGYDPRWSLDDDE
jgi:hypothetical protein